MMNRFFVKRRRPDSKVAMLACLSVAHMILMGIKRCDEHEADQLLADFFASNDKDGAAAILCHSEESEESAV